MAAFLTLASVRQQLWEYARAEQNTVVPYAARTAADSAVVDGKIAQVCERFLTAINFRGSFATARLRVFDSQITLPNPLDGIRSLRLVDEAGNLGRQYEVFSQQANYANGSCWPFGFDYWSGISTGGSNNGGIRDLGGDWPTFRDGTGTYYIRAKTLLTEPTPTTILLRGLDENGTQIYTVAGEEGVELAITTADTTTTQKFTALTSWVRDDETVGIVQLYAVDTTTGDEELLVNITPRKLTSGYRRYSAIGFADNQTIEALCNIAHVPAVNDNDPVMPAHIGALKLGLLALQYEDKNDMERADSYMERAINLLDQDRDTYDGDEVSNVVFSGFGSWGFGRSNALVF